MQRGSIGILMRPCCLITFSKMRLGSIGVVIQRSDLNTHWWDVEKGKIKQLRLEDPLNVTRDMTASVKVSESDITMLQNFTREREHFKVLKRKTSRLYQACWVFSTRGARVRSRYQNIVKMDAPSLFFFFFSGRECENGQRRPVRSQWSAGVYRDP